MKGNPNSFIHLGKMSLMHRTLLISALVFLFLFSSVHAQQVARAEDILGPIWDAIHNLENEVSHIKDQMHTFYLEYVQFTNDVISNQQDVNASMGALQQADVGLQNQISATNVIVQENTDTLNVHTQEIGDLNQTTEALKQTDQELMQTDAELEQTDMGLQNQIDGFTTNINRSKIYEVVNTNPNANTVFCDTPTDILLFGICPSGFSSPGTSTISILFDNFDDQDYTANPTWTVRNGSWGVNYWGPNSGKLITTSQGGNGNLISTPTSFDAMTLSMEAKVTANNYLEQLHIALSDNPSSMWNGYDLRLYVNGQFSFLEFTKVTLGEGTMLSHVTGFDLSPDLEYSIKATRDESGIWQLFLNESPVGQQFTDTSYTNFTDTFLLGYQINNAGSQFDDVNVTIPNPQQGDSSPFLNIGDINSPMGIQCKTNSTARALCLQQD